MKWRKLVAVCTVGVVLALLLGGLPSADQIHSAVVTSSSIHMGAPVSWLVCELADRS